DYNKGNNIENNISHCAFLRTSRAPARKPNRSPKAVIVYPSYTYPSRIRFRLVSQTQSRCTAQVPDRAQQVGRGDTASRREGRRVRDGGGEPVRLQSLRQRI